MRPSSVRLLPLVNLFKRLLSGERKSLVDCAGKVEEIQPAETQHHPRAIYVPASLDRIIAAHPWTTVPLELAHLETETKHHPVIRYELEDVLVHSVGLDSRTGASTRIGRGFLTKYHSNPIASLDSATYCMTGAVRSYFGHWLRDGCATALLAPSGDPLILSADESWRDSSCYLNAFDLAPERADTIFVRRLSLFQDYSQGSSKQRRYKELRQRIRLAHPHEDDGPRKVYLRRGTTGAQRMLANEGGLVGRLEKEGFDIVDMLALSMESLAYRLRSARMIVSVEGSHVNHVYFCAPDHAKVLLLIPADRVSLVHVGISRGLGFRFGFCIVSPGPDGYIVDINEFLSVLEALHEDGTDR